MYLLQGTELNNRYVIEGLLGHGGFGITYSAYDKVLNVRVAVKEYLPRQLATRAEGQTKVSVYSGEAREHYDYGLRKFMEEAQSVARFSHHPNIVSARDYFEANGTAYMVMEYIEGVTLKEYIEKKGGRISFEEAKGIMMPVMDALREVHQAGLLHRDISPDNIYITTSAQVKILDFGAARYFAGEQSKSLSVILKPGYAPEEQYRSSGKQGSWTDVYAVGATIYKALTGRTPPDALDRKEEDTLEPPSRLGVSIPADAEQALLQALAVTASQRFQTMGEFQQALLGGEPMTVGFQRAPVSFEPPPGPAHGPTSVSGSALGSSPSLDRAQPGLQPPQHPSQSHQLPRRSAGPAAIAAGIAGGLFGLVLLVGLVWYMFGGKGLSDPKEKNLKEGISYLQSQDYPQARLALEKARDLAPNDARIHLQLAKAYHGLKLYAEEVKACQEVIRLDPANVEARYLLGMDYVRMGKKDLALGEYSHIKDKQPVELGKQLFAAIHPPTEPKIKNARELLTKGIDFYKAKNSAQAEAALKESVDLNPKDAMAYSYLGLTYAGLNRWPEAISAYRQAINLKPDSAEFHLNLGTAYDKSGKPEEAIEAWKAAIRHKPDFGEAYQNLAAAYWRLGQKDLALEQYKLLQAKDPSQINSLKEKNPDLARYVDQASPSPGSGVTSTPAAPPSDVAKEVLARGRDYYQAKDYAKAQEALAEVVKLSPQEAEAHYYLGLTYASLKRPLPDTLGELRQAVTLKPEAYSWRHLGSELATLDRNKEAAEALKEAVKTNEKDAEARYLLGEAYVKLGEIKQAREEHKVLKDQEKELAQKLLASINSKAGGGKSLERQIDEEARRIRIKRGEIPAAGATATRPSTPSQPPPARPKSPRDVQFGFGPSTVKQR